MIDYDFEERLHRRIDARQAIAGLSQRERGVLAALYRHSDKQEVVAFEQGVSRGTIGQIRDKAIRRLRYRLQPPRRPTPLAPKPAPQHGFDKAAFLAHMRELHALREWERAEKAAWAANAPARAWECELRELRCQIAREAERQQAARQREADEAARQERERQRALALEAVRRERVSPERLQSLANEALGHLLLWRQPMTDGLPTVGESYSNVTFASATGQISTAVEKLMTQIPYEARLSAREWRSLDPLCAFASNRFAAVRVIALNDGSCYRIDVTWTPCWT